MSDFWRDPMPEDMARRVLGNEHFDWIIARGAARCSMRAMDCWHGNQQEGYGAYRTAERIAKSRIEVTA